MNHMNHLQPFPESLIQVVKKMIQRACEHTTFASLMKKHNIMRDF